MEMLVELDRLIQLIESPIFTCKFALWPPVSLIIAVSRKNGKFY
jgi:hypothetical protein